MRILQSTLEIIDQLHFDVEGMLLSAGINYGAKSRKKFNVGIDRWSPTEARPIARYFPNSLVQGFAPNPRSPWLYACAHDPAWRLNDEYGYFTVDLRTGRQSWLELRSPFWSFAVARDGSWMLGSANEARGRRFVRWRQLEDGSITRHHELLASSLTVVSIIGLLDESALTFEAEYSPVERAWTSRRFVLRACADWSSIRSFEPPDRTYVGVQLSPDRSRLVARSGPSILVWERLDDTERPRLIRAGRLHLTSLAFHPSGRYLAATSNDTTVKLYDTNTWQLARTYSWNIGRLRSIAFSPDGTLAAAGSDTGRIVVWDVDD